MDSKQSIDRFNAAVQAYVDMFGQVPWGIDMPEPDVVAIEQAVKNKKAIDHLPYDEGVVY